MASGKCCVFIDNSNLFIEGQKFFARHQKLRMTVDQDIRFRIDIGQMVEELVQGREKIYVKLYGSEPPPNDSLWQGIRNRGILVSTFKRNSVDYEKELDTSLTADVTEQACEIRGSPSESVTFIIIGGDRDYLPAYEKVLKKGWKLEAVAWKSCLSQKIREYVKTNEHKDVKLILLDDLAIRNPDIYFLADRWTAHKCRLPHDRTIVFEFNEAQDDKRAKQLNSEVTNLMKLPCSYRHRPEKDPNIVMIVIIPSEKDGGYNMSNLYQDLKTRLAKRCKQIVDLVTFIQEKNHPILQDDVLFNYEQLEEEEEDVSMIPDTKGAAVEAEFTVVEPKRRKVKQKFSEQCPYRYACRRGKGCQYAHSNDEKAHFETYPQRVGKLYKAKFCRGVDNNQCQYMRNSKLCTYAHGIHEARCYNCEPGGLVGQHWMDQCPKKIS